MLSSAEILEVVANAQPHEAEETTISTAALLPTAISTGLRDHQVPQGWMQARLAVFSGGTADPWLSAVPQDPRVQRNPLLPQRFYFSCLPTWEEPKNQQLTASSGRPQGKRETTKQRF